MLLGNTSKKKATWLLGLLLNKRLKLWSKNIIFIYTYIHIRTHSIDNEEGVVDFAVVEYLCRGIEKW